MNTAQKCVSLSASLTMFYEKIFIIDILPQYCSFLMIDFGFSFQAIDLFMSSCMIFVFLSLIEYAFVNVMMGDISDGNKMKSTYLYIHQNYKV